MKAARLHGFGGPENVILEDVAAPRPGTGEYLIQVRAAGVNPVDWKTREHEGIVKPDQLPFILGWDVAGVVTDLGAGADDN